MMTLDLEVVDHLLTTTRSVRKRLDFDAPVEMADILRCIEIAIQAPSGSNRQGWRFVLVTSDEKKAAIAEFYRQALSLDF
jgi:nitroreductase